MNAVQFLTTDGEDLVVLSRRDYDALLARAGDPDAEDAMTARIVAEARGLTALPMTVWDRIEDGEPAVAVLLDYRAMSPAELARRTGLGEAEVAGLLQGEAPVAPGLRAKLCEALDVSPDVFEG